jgi:hypothetical protein
MKKNLLFFVNMLFLLALIFAALSCMPQKRLARLLKNNPNLIDTITRIDTTIIIDSIYESRKELSKSELDSLLSDYCNDTVINNVVYRDQIKERIIYRATEPRHETVILENGTLFINRDSGGTEYKLETIKETVYQDRIFYLGKEQEIFKWIAMGAFGMLLAILLFLALVKWGFK